MPRNQPGARRVDDRRVISGIIHVLRVGRRWQDCPADYRPSTTIYNRFNRWSHRGLWARRPPLRPRGKGGAQVQAIGRSRGGPTTRIHALTDGYGRAVAVLLSPGNCADISAAPALLDKMPAPRRLLADKGHDGNSLRARLAATRTEAVIPSTRSRRRTIPHDAATYAGRNLIERAFCRRKDWRRIATRYDKLAVNFASAVAIAAIILWWA